MVLQTLTWLKSFCFCNLLLFRGHITRLQRVGGAWFTHHWCISLTVWFVWNGNEKDIEIYIQFYILCSRKSTYTLCFNGCKTVNWTCCLWCDVRQSHYLFWYKCIGHQKGLKGLMQAATFIYYFLFKYHARERYLHLKYSNVWPSGLLSYQDLFPEEQQIE